MCTTMKGSYTCLSYNTNNIEDTKWNQYGGTGFTLNANMRSRMTERGSGGHSTKLRRWNWVCIGGKDGVATIFVSVYQPYKSINGLKTVWNQQAQYFKHEEVIKYYRETARVY